MYTTKVTWLGNVYGCRVFKDDELILEGRASSRDLIGATFRDLLRTIDKCSEGDSFTSAARHRNSKSGNLCIGVKHIWH
jgi:hypothetical protein